MKNGTLLGRRIIDQQQNCKNRIMLMVLEVTLPNTNEKNKRQSQKEKQVIIIYSTIMDFVRYDDLLLLGIVNPTQLVASMGLDWIGVDSNG